MKLFQNLWMFVLCVIVAESAVAQINSRVIAGNVRSKIDYSLIDSYKIDLLSSNELIESKQIDNKDAKFDFNIDPQKEYTLRVKKDSFYTEEIDVQSEKVANADFYRITIGDDTTSFLLEGIVLDKDGVALDSVFVRITNVMTHFERWAYTNAGGRYKFRLRKGYDYKIKAKKEGYLYDEGNVLYCENKLEKNSRYCLQYFDDARYLSKAKTGE